MSVQTPRIEQWSRGNALPVSILATTIKDATGAVATPSAVRARVHAAGTAEPPVNLAGRSVVNLSLADGVWRGQLAYGTDLDGLSTVRVVVEGTFGSATARLADAQVTLIRPSGR